MICYICDSYFVSKHGTKYCSDKCRDIAKKNQDKLYINKNKDKKKEYDRQRYLNNKEVIKKRVKIWRRENRDIRNAYERERCSSPQMKIYKYCLSIIKRALVSGRAGNRVFFKKVDYSYKELEEHLKSTLKEGMTWELFLTTNSGIEIDHIKPACMFNYSSMDDKEFLECWHYSNLQLLFAKDNQSKWANYED